MNTKGPKIALCLFGQPRFFEINKTLLEKIIKPYNPDVFIHSWWSKEDIGKEYSTGPWSAIDYRCKPTVQEHTPELLEKIYKPIKMSLEAIKELPLDTNSTDFTNLNVRSTFYTKYSVIQLKNQYEKDNNFIYDIVILTRLDARLKEFTIDLYKPNFLTVPAPLRHTEEGIFNHNFIITDSETIDTYASIYNEIPKYFDEGIGVNHENMVRHHVAKTGLLVNKEVGIKQTFFRSKFDDYDWEL